MNPLVALVIVLGAVLVASAAFMTLVGIRDELAGIREELARLRKMVP